MADGQPKMVFLGFGKYARADKIYALEPLRGDERGDGRRTRVWIEGVSDPIVASRTERTILDDMGSDAAVRRRARSTTPSTSRAGSSSRPSPGRVDLGDLSRRARRLLEATARRARPEQLF